MKEFWKKSNVPTILLAVILSLALWTTVQLNSGKVRQETIFRSEERRVGKEC